MKPVKNKPHIYLLFRGGYGVSLEHEFHPPDGLIVNWCKAVEFAEEKNNARAILAAPTPERAQPVARDKKLDRDLHSQLMNVAFAAFDGGYKCRPAKETVRTIVKALAAFYEKRAGSTPERADAEKDAAAKINFTQYESFYEAAKQVRNGMSEVALRIKPGEQPVVMVERAQESEGVRLSDDQIREIWMRETGTTEQDSPLAILDFARAVLATVRLTRSQLGELYHTARNADSFRSFQKVADEILAADKEPQP